MRVLTDTTTGSDRASVYLSDTTASATAGLQVLLNTASKTYNLDLHLYHVQGSNPTCEVFGTVRVATVM